MLGPASCPLCLPFLLALCPLKPVITKPVSAGLALDPGPSARYRRDPLPYEAEMFLQAGSDPSRLAAYRPADSLGPRLGPGLTLGLRPQEAERRLRAALRELSEERSRRREEEEAYLARLLATWKELGLVEAYQPDVGLRPRYQGDEALPGRRAYYEGAEPEAGPESEADDEEVVRYLVGRLLANMEAPDDYPRRAEREPAAPRRARRSSGGAEGPVNLLRVKRLGEGGEYLVPGGERLRGRYYGGNIPE